MSNSAGTVFKTRFLPGDAPQVLSEHISFHTACRASPGYKRLQKASCNLQSVDRLCKIPFKNCGSCLKAAILIFKYPPQNVKMWVVFGRERVYSCLMHKQLINGQPECIMNILWIGLLADERVWAVLNTNCPIVESLDEGKANQESLKWRDGMFEAFRSSRQMHFPVQRTQTKDCVLSNWIWFKVLSLSEFVAVDMNTI